MVPVWAMPRAQPVSTPSLASSSSLVDRGLVLGDPLGEALDDLLARRVILAAVAPLDAYVRGTLLLGDVARGAADAPEDRLSRVRHQPPLRLCLHHWRKLCSGTGLRSRTSVQPASLPGRRWIVPARASGH